LFSVTAPAQSPQPDGALSFEVASIRPAPFGPGAVRGGCHGIDSVFGPAEEAHAAPLGRCVITDGRLSHMVGIAWDISMPMLKTGPDWIQRGDERFNLQAKAEFPAKTTEKQLLQMLQNLLTQRFQMKFHWEKVEMPGFGLTVAKGGSKLEESKSADTKISFGPGGKRGNERGGKPGGGAGVIKATRYSMRDFVQLLSIFGDRGPGVDHTGLAGLYDFTLSWNEETGPGLETALHEQLGLRIQSEKVQTSYFVIDSAHRPSEN
jgi:uncharacterized protein (TIGR03435 family)